MIMKFLLLSIVSIALAVPTKQEKIEFAITHVNKWLPQPTLI